MTPKQQATFDREIIQKMSPEEFAGMQMINDLAYGKSPKIVVALSKARRAYIRYFKK